MCKGVFSLQLKTRAHPSFVFKWTCWLITATSFPTPSCSPTKRKFRVVFFFSRLYAVPWGPRKHRRKLRSSCMPGFDVSYACEKKKEGQRVCTRTPRTLTKEGKRCKLFELVRKYTTRLLFFSFAWSLPQQPRAHSGPNGLPGTCVYFLSGPIFSDKKLQRARDNKRETREMGIENIIFFTKRIFLAYDKSCKTQLDENQAKRPRNKIKITKKTNSTASKVNLEFYWSANLEL